MRQAIAFFWFSASFVMFLLSGGNAAWLADE